MAIWNLVGPEAFEAMQRFIEREQALAIGTSQRERTRLSTTRGIGLFLRPTYDPGTALHLHRRCRSASYFTSVLAQRVCLGNCRPPLGRAHVIYYAGCDRFRESNQWGG